PVPPPAGVLPPRPAVVPSAQTPWFEPTVAVGCCFTVITASEVALVPQAGLVTVHLNVIVPAPLVGVKVAFGVVAPGLKVPVAPAATIDQVPVASSAGVLPPRPAVVPRSQRAVGRPRGA